MRKYFLLLIAALIIAFFTSSVALANQQQSGWLGVVLTPVPRALTAHLPLLLANGQGLMVQQVESNSPAVKAGIQTFDILLMLDDQKLYSPAQLSKLLSSVEPGKKSNLQLVREASIMAVQVEITPRLVSRMNRIPFRFGQPYPVFPQRPQFSLNASSAWDSFESVAVNTLGNGRYHAEVKFKNHNNEMKSFIFEGRKEEIIQQIQQQQDLPADKRVALLNALNMRSDSFPSPFNTPFYQGNPFNHQFFQRNFFNDQFKAPFYYRYPN